MADKKTGRPTKYSKALNDRVFKFALLGMTDEQMAAALEITTSTFYKWQHDHPTFSESLKRGKYDADGEVVASLYSRAMGYSHPEDKIFNNNGEALIVTTVKHYPPDPTSIIFWMKNRQPDLWRERQKDENMGEALGKLDQVLNGITKEMD